MDPSQRRAGVAALFDQLAHGYDRGGVPWFGPIDARLVELTAPRPGDRALEVGAGRGAATFPLVDAVGPTGHVTAVDLSPAMARHLRSEAELRDATARIATALEPNRGEDGQLHLTQQVRYTTATRPWA